MALTSSTGRKGIEDPFLSLNADEKSSKFDPSLIRESEPETLDEKEEGGRRGKGEKGVMHTKEKIYIAAEKMEVFVDQFMDILDDVLIKLEKEKEGKDRSENNEEEDTERNADNSCSEASTHHKLIVKLKGLHHIYIISDRSIAKCQSSSQSNDNYTDDEEVKEVDSMPNYKNLHFIRKQPVLDRRDSAINNNTPENYVNVDQSCTFYSSTETISKLLGGKMNPVFAFMSGKVKLEGNRKVLSRFRESFRICFEEMKKLHPSFFTAPTNSKATKFKSDSDLGYESEEKNESHQTLMDLTKYINECLLNGDQEHFPHREVLGKRKKQYWEPDWARDDCGKCGARFNTIRRKHHCRQCGILCCHTCSRFRVKSQRVCSSCVEQIHTILHDDRDEESKTEVSRNSMDSKESHSRSYNRSSRSESPKYEGILSHKLNNKLHKLQAEQIECLRVSTTDVIPDRSILKRSSQPLMTVRDLVASIQKVIFIKAKALIGSILKMLVISLSFFIVFEYILPESFYSSIPLLFVVSLLLLLSPASTFISISLSLIPSRYLHTLLTTNVIKPEMDPQIIIELVVFICPFIVSIRYFFLLYIYPFLSRSVKIYSTASIVIGAYTLASYGMHRLKFSESRKKDAYDLIDSFIAPFVTKSLMDLRSVFIKFGQYIGGRTDVVPPNWAKAMSKLQDQNFTSSAAYVEKTIRSQFKKPINEIFESFDYVPLASASVAQVHKAKLLDSFNYYGSNRNVAVKVQHEGIDSLMRSDMIAAIRIAKVVSFLSPEFGVMLTILTSWANELDHELDFQYEASNLRRVKDNMQRSGIDVMVPIPYENFTAKKVFLMEYIDGWKITDLTAMENFYNIKINRKTLMSRIIQAYSQQFYVDGFFNADPHAGNLMVSYNKKENKVIPVLLDFGMTIELTEKKRQGYCKLVYNANNLDLTGAVQGLREIGYLTSQSNDHPERDVEFFAYLMRDTGSAQKQKESRDEFFQKRKEQKEQDIENIKEKEAKKKKNLGIEKERKSKKIKAPSRYMKEIPSDLVFLFRVLGLLRGLCTTLEVEIQYLYIMSLYAEKSLMSSFSPNIRAMTVTNQGSRFNSNPSNRTNESLFGLEQELQYYIRKMFKSDDLIGGQICILENGEVNINIPFGARGRVDPRPVTLKTLFPLLDVSNFLCCVCVHTLLQQNLLSSKVSLVQDHQKTSLVNLLAHSSGLHDILPHNTLGGNLYDYNKVVNVHIESIIEKIKEEMKEELVNEIRESTSEVKYHILSQGYLLNYLVKRETGFDINDILEREFTLPMKLNDEIFFGFPKSGNGELDTMVSSCSFKKDIAIIANGYADQIKGIMKMGEEIVSPVSVDEKVNRNTNSSDTVDPVEYDQKEEMRRKYEDPLSNGDPFSGMILHPGMVNDPILQESYAPSINSMGTAHGLAKICDSFVQLLTVPSTCTSIDTHKSDPKPITPSTLSDIFGTELHMFGLRDWGLGFLIDQDEESSSHPYDWIGFESQGSSSVVYSCPRARITVAIALNNLTLNRKASQTITKIICRSRGLRCPRFIVPDDEDASEEVEEGEEDL